MIAQRCMMILLGVGFFSLAQTEPMEKLSIDTIRQQFCVVNKERTCNTATEYLCEANLNIEEWTAECSDENAHACLCAGVKYEENKSIEDAMKQYQQACDLGDGRGCHALGNVHRSQYWATKDFSYEIKATEYFQNSCEIGYLASCQSLGYLWVTNDTQRKILSQYHWIDRSEVFAILRKNCIAGFFPSCDLLIQDFIPLRYRLALRGQHIQLLSYICEHHQYARACEIIGNIYFLELQEEIIKGRLKEFDQKMELQTQNKLAQLVSRVKNIEEKKKQKSVIQKDHRPETIVHFYQKACELSPKGNEGCFDLGQLYLLGEIVEKNYIKAEKYFDQSCNVTRSRGDKQCETMVKMFKEASVNYLRKACDLGDANACIKTAELHIMKYMANFRSIKTQYNSVLRSSYSAIPLYRKACELKSGEGCFKESMFYFMPDGPLSFDYWVADKYYAYGAERLKKACDYQYDEACEQIEVFKKDSNLRKYFY